MNVRLIRHVGLYPALVKSVKQYLLLSHKTPTVNPMISDEFPNDPTEEKPGTRINEFGVFFNL